jgi:hypothetical protein
MNRAITSGLAAAAVLAAGGLSAPAAAQAMRTWVSGVGDDVNPCSRTAPCKTFAGAISKTAAGGEINCLDPGGFGAVTITKAMTIACQYTGGGVLAGGNGIVVNAGLEDVVYLKGLDIFGVNPPSNGVQFVGGKRLHIENSVIRRFSSGSSFGIRFAPKSASQLVVTDTVVADNGQSQGGGGILIEPASGGSAQVVLKDVTIAANGGVGIRAKGKVTGAVSDSVITGHVTGIEVQEGASLASSGDNVLIGNDTDGGFSGKASER